MAVCTENRRTTPIWQPAAAWGLCACAVVAACGTPAHDDELEFDALRPDTSSAGPDAEPKKSAAQEIAEALGKPQYFSPGDWWDKNDGARSAAEFAQGKANGAKGAKAGTACPHQHGMYSGWDYDAVLGLPVSHGGCVVQPSTVAYNAAIVSHIARFGWPPNSLWAAKDQLRRAKTLSAGQHRWFGVVAEVFGKPEFRLKLQVADDADLCGVDERADLQWPAIAPRFAVTPRAVVIEAGSTLIVIVRGGHVTIHDDSAAKFWRAWRNAQLGEIEVELLCRDFQSRIAICAEKVGKWPTFLRLTIDTRGKVSRVDPDLESDVNARLGRCIRRGFGQVSFGYQRKVKTLECSQFGLF